MTAPTAPDAPRGARRDDAPTATTRSPAGVPNGARDDARDRGARRGAPRVASPGAAPARVWAERALRATALAAVALAAWRRLQPAPPSAAARPAVADARALPAALARWTAAAPPRAHAALDALPDDTTRAWLAALAAAGTPVTWNARRAPALAVEATPVADPAGGVRIRVAAPAGADPALADALGPLADAPDAPGPGAAARAATDARGPAATTVVRTRTVPDAAGALAAAVDGGRARAAIPAAPRLGEIVLLGRAGWEARFVAAALEERGWTVRARLAVAPGVVPGAAALPALDTARVAAVVALDSSAAPLAPAIGAYVRRGGGLVLAGDAALAPALRALAPATPGPRPGVTGGGAPAPAGPVAAAAPATPGAAASATAGASTGGASTAGAATAAPGAAPAVASPPAGGAPLGAPPAGVPIVRPLLAPRADAVPLGGGWARRVGAGRVVQVAAEESWPLRLSPTADVDGPAAHRAYWASAVAAAAYAPTPAAPSSADGIGGAPSLDPAPLATVVAALGPESPAPVAPSADAPGDAPSRVPGDAWLLGAALGALLAEVASRRLRGAA